MSRLLDIGASLAGARRAAGVSQRELADRLGSSQQQIARWEASDYREASLARTSAAAEALGICVTLESYNLPIAAESASQYRAGAVLDRPAPTQVIPVRDLGEIASRMRALGSEFAKYGVARIGVFGSFAGGEQEADSDVDLLVEFSNRPTGFAYMEPVQLAEKVLGRAVDWVEPHLVRERLRDRILAEVIYVWEA